MIAVAAILLNIYTEALVREAVEDLEEGINFGRSWINALRFADDQAMIARSQGSLQAMMNRPNTVSNEYME